MTDARIRAEIALQDLERAVLLLLKDYPEGLRNVEVSRLLGLESSFEGGQRNYLSMSILGRLLERGEVRVLDNPKDRFRRYVGVD